MCGEGGMSHATRGMGTSSNDQCDHLAVIALGDVVVLLQASTIELVGELGNVHREIWNYEDLARSVVAGPSLISDVKRSIDRLNAKRHNLVDAIDHEVVRLCPMPNIRYSETPGEICDRLLIITLKFLANSEIIDDSSVPVSFRRDARCRISHLHVWREHLQKCLSSELRDIAAGCAAIPPRAEFKLYNDEIMNPVLRAERQRTS
jgi:hypothetical protein